MDKIFIPLLLLFNAFIAVIVLVGAILMSLKKNGKPDRARKLLRCLFILIGIGCCLKIIESVINPDPAIYDEVLILPYMLITLLFQCMLIFYPMEVMKPNWINLKKGFLLLSPFIVILILYYILDFDYIHLYNLEDIQQNLNKPDVIFRLITVFLMVPYSIMLPLIQYQEKRITLVHLGLVIYSLGLVLSCILVTITMLTGILEFYIVYIANALCLAVYLLYYEMRVRCYKEKAEGQPEETCTEIPEACVETPKEDSSIKKTPEPLKILPDFTTTAAGKEDTLEDKIFNEILYQFDEKKIWKFSNLDIQSLAHEAGTNKTYVLKCIKEKTGYNYVEFVNRKRIEFVISQLKENPKQNLKDLFTEAGFNSRTTAWRNFKNIVGMTPTEYLKAINN